MATVMVEAAMEAAHRQGESRAVLGLCRTSN